LGQEAHQLAENLCRDYGLLSSEGEYVSFLGADLERVAKDREWRRTARASVPSRWSTRAP